MPAFLFNKGWISQQRTVGFSWIELLILFEISCNLPVTTPKQRQDEEVSIQQLVSAFKKVALAVAERQPLTPDESPLTPTKAKGAPLATYGIRTMFGAVQGIPEVSDEHAAALKRAILTQRGLPTGEQWKNFVEGTLKAAPTHVPNHTLPLWRKVAAKHATNSTIMWKLQCPHCEGEMLFHGKPLKHSSGWPKRRCEHCNVESRLGAARCTACFEKLAECLCPAYRAQKELSARGDRLRRLLQPHLAVSRIVPESSGSDVH